MEIREANQLIKIILDIGEEFIKSGSETWRTEDTLYRLCYAYDFKKVNIWLIPTNIQVSVETPEGEIITQVRYVPYGSYNYDRLDYLNNLSRKACASKPDAMGLRVMLDEVMNRPQQKLWVAYLAAILSATCFTIFFNGDWLDAIVTGIAATLMTFIGRRLSKIETNPLTYNAIQAFIAELFVLLSVKLGFGHHHTYITIGLVMLLIGAVGFTNGVREMLNRDFISGGINIVNAILGATGIAVGIALAFLLMRGVM